MEYKPQSSVNSCNILFSFKSNNHCLLHKNVAEITFQSNLCFEYKKNKELFWFYNTNWLHHKVLYIKCNQNINVILLMNLKIPSKWLQIWFYYYFTKFVPILMITYGVVTIRQKIQFRKQLQFKLSRIDFFKCVKFKCENALKVSNPPVTPKRDVQECSLCII